MEKYIRAFHAVDHGTALAKRRNIKATLILIKVTSHTQSGSAMSARCANSTTVSGNRCAV
jgi:hypothetical protein